MSRYNDDELLYLSRQGCVIAYQLLIEEYYIFIKLLVHKMKLQQIKYVDGSDISQMAMISCIQAFDSYRPDRNSKLRTFMSRVIQNNVLSSIKKITNEHTKYFAFSLDGAPSTTTMSYEEIIADKKLDYQPKEMLYVKEAKTLYQGYVENNCSPLEKGVLGYRLEGYSNQDIATKMSVDIKSIYNAVYRLQKKLAYLK
ncbi:MAG: sigma factor [Coprobacillaceae bacterium]